MNIAERSKWNGLLENYNSLKTCLQRAKWDLQCQVFLSALR
jgi:hypothetical protein